MKQYQVTMPDGTVWGVPVSEIARSHAAYYAEHDTGGDVEKCFNEHSLPLLLANPMEVWEWAAGNMNWVDVMPVARLVSGFGSTTEADYQDGWVNGAHEVADVDDTTVPSAAVSVTDGSGWVSTAGALPSLERIPACRAGMVEVAALHQGGEWVFEHRHAANVRHQEVLKTFWRYLADAPTLAA